MTAHDRIRRDAERVASLTSIKRVRVEDDVRAGRKTNGGEKRTASRLSAIVRRLEKSLS